VSAVFCLIAGVLVLAWYVGAFAKQGGERSALATYLIASLVPLSAAFGVFFVASMTTQHFRYVGFVMVPISILGAVAISTGAERLRPSLGERWVRVGLVVVFLLLLPMPLMTTHGSPFIYQPSADVTQMELSGTEATVEYMDRDVAFAGIRGGPRRQLHGTQGTVGSERLRIEGQRASIPPVVFGSNLTTHYDSPRYVPVSRSDYQREVVLYNGFRYPERGFERLRTSPGSTRSTVTASTGSIWSVTSRVRERRNPVSPGGPGLSLRQAPTDVRTRRPIWSSTNSRAISPRAGDTPRPRRLRRSPDRRRRGRGPG